MSKKIKALSILATLALTASMAVPAFAADENGEVGGAVPTDNGTQVWAGVAVDEPDMRVRVTVPTLFAFVVNGTVDSTKASQAVTVENDGLLLPNVKVTNASGTAEDGQSYKLVTEGKSDLEFTNYSTQKGEDDAITNRKGLAVTLKGTIQNEGTAESRNQWTHVGTTPAQTVGQDFKKYQLEVNDEKFTALSDGSGRFGMSTGITLAAPDTGNGNIDSTTGLALVGNVTDAEFGVYVGGVRGDYKNAENSAKVGTITWVVEAQASVAAQTP